MARSNIKTWLPLDRWAEIIGIHPAHFNQVSVDNFVASGNVCGEIFFQYSWQNADRVGRDDIAMCIQQAEQEIAQQVGYNLIPDWTYNERLAYPHPQVPGAYNLWGMNQNGQRKSVELNKGHVISGGIRAKTLIQAGAVIVRSDVDGDGFQETCTIIVPITTTDTNEVHVYYPATSGDDGWEVRPIKVAISGGFATIIFKVWQVVAAGVMDYLDPQAIDATVPANFEAAVDVYRVYNDPSSQVLFLWEQNPISCCGQSTCAACQMGTQTGCFVLRDPRMGMTVPAPASWNASTLAFDSACWAGCREPDQIEFSYYSGYRDQSVNRPYVTLAPYWEYAIAFLAASKLDRPVCGCSNVSEFIQKWRVDAAFADAERGGYSVTPEMASNQLGTTMGALYAYKQIHRPGIRVNK